MISQLAYLALKKRRRAGFVGYYVLSVGLSTHWDSRTLENLTSILTLCFEGINFAPSFSRRTTHLLCPSRTGAKHDKAQEWGIPMVGMEWLVQLIEGAQVPRLVSASVPQAELKMDTKGKSRSKTPEPQITPSGKSRTGGLCGRVLTINRRK